LSTLVTALKAADLVETLGGEGPFTVFAPTNAAFDALPFGGAELTYLLNTKDKLTEVLEYHVTKRNVPSSDLFNDSQIPMLDGGDTTITIKNGTIMINQATVTTADVKAINGVVHIIDKVLIPASFTAPNIPQLAQSANLTIFHELVVAANLFTALSGGPITVFAPTNAAFAALPNGTLQKLLDRANIKDLQQILTYHVHSGEVVSADLKSGEQVSTLEGSKLNITISGSTVTVNTAKVTKADQFAVNGVVHVIDEVLLPPDYIPLGSIPGIAEQTKDLSLLLTALKAADLVETLEGAGPFTVFAPTNAAFDALPFGGAELTYLLNNKDKLTEVLEYHVTKGNFASSNLSNGEKIPMLAGGNTTVTIDGSTVMINQATVTTADVKATNGVVHIIDKVLIPTNFTAPNIPQLAQSANLTTLLTAVTAANLSTALSGGPLTVFAPTNAAFDALPNGTLQKLLDPANIKDLQQVLQYHVHPGEVVSADLKSGEQVSTLEGSKLNITINNSTVKVNNATVTKADQFAINGVVHVIDAVLLPPDFVPPASTKSAKILIV